MFTMALFVKDEHFCQKSKFWEQLDILIQNQNFHKKIKKKGKKNNIRKNLTQNFYRNFWKWKSLRDIEKYRK